MVASYSRSRCPHPCPRRFLLKPAHAFVYNPSGKFSSITLSEKNIGFCQDPGDEKDDNSFYMYRMYIGKGIGKKDNTRLNRAHRRDSFVSHDNEIMETLKDFKSWPDIGILTFGFKRP